MEIVEFQPRASGSGKRRSGDEDLPTDATIHPIGAQAAVHALVAATSAAGYAPSIHGTQPWRWRLSGHSLDLHLDAASVDELTDADGRLATISCGAALHHARVSLAAQGWDTTVTRLPDQADPDLLARLRIGDRSTVDAPSSPHLRTIPLRYTDRDPATGPPVGTEHLTAILAAVRSEDTWLHVLYPDEVLELATVAEHAQRTASDDSGWLGELSYWNGYGRTAAARPTGRVPGRPGELPTSAANDKGATFALLHGPTDEPEDWLRAGEALSAGWLTAVELGVSVLPLSAPIEVRETRQAIQIMIGSVGYPYLLLRLGTVDPADPGLQHTPRLPVDQIVERS
jgi:nitroreductase